MSVRDRWVLLSYRLPRDPSAPRLAVWRRLKRLGVAQLLDGLVALPLDSRNREQLEWAAEQVVEAGGQAAVWVADATTAAQSRVVAAQMAASISRQYGQVVRDARAARQGSAPQRRRTLARLRRELGRIARRDYFPPPEREAAREAVESLAATIEDVAA
jgi:hypothetical protein